MKFKFNYKNKPLVAFVAIVLIVTGGAVLIYNNDDKGEYETGSVSLETILSSSSKRTEIFTNETKGAVIVDDENPYYALIASNGLTCISGL